MVAYGQVVVGAPGAGKTTYCAGLQQYCAGLGREAAVVNLDPANHVPPYTAAVDIAELVQLDAVMDEFGLGPNGALVYCMEFLEMNLDWLVDKLQALGSKYIIFDFPGQIELFTHATCVSTVLAHLSRRDMRLTAVNLMDAHHCSDASKFISASLLSLSTMLRLEMPHVNVLSKVDLIEQYGSLPFNLEFFTDLQDLSRLLPYLDSRPAEDTPDGVPAASPPAAEGTQPDPSPGPRATFLHQRRRLNAALCELIEDFGLVSYETLNIQDAESVGHLLAKVDRANGYVFTTSENSTRASASYASTLFRAVSAEETLSVERTLRVQEKYMSFGKGEGSSQFERLRTAAGDEDDA